MDKVVIEKGGELILHSKENRINVTKSLPTFLLTECKLADKLTLKDIFILCEKHKDLLSVLLHKDWFAAYLKEGLTAKSKQRKTDIVEYLELYSYAELWDDTNLEITKIPAFHGMGPVLKRDKKTKWGDTEAFKGTRIAYAIEFSPIAELIDLPIKLADKTMFCDIRDLKKLIKLEVDSIDFTLLDIIHGIFWELSFSGSPTDKTAKWKELTQMVKEITKKPKKTKKK